MSRKEAVSRLREMALWGLEERDGLADEEKTERLERELLWLDRREDDFLQRFLILWDACEYARCTDNPTGPGMGTLPGSTLAYGLGITGPDPVLAGLRSPLQSAPPRLAMELSPDIMEEVRTYLWDTYGAASESIHLVENFHLRRFRQVLTGDSPADPVWHLPETETEGARYALENMPLDDPAVFDFLPRGKEICGFEPPEAWTLLQDLRPRSLEELTAAFAFRALPGRNGMGDPRYILYKRARQECRDAGPYGWLLYREQTADLLRDSRKRGDEAAFGRLDSGLTEVLRCWNLPWACGDEIAEFSPAIFLLSRGVPKSHAAARALLTYQDTYLRVHYPEEYERAKYWYLDLPGGEPEI